MICRVEKCDRGLASGLVHQSTSNFQNLGWGESILYMPSYNIESVSDEVRVFVFSPLDILSHW